MFKTSARVPWMRTVDMLVRVISGIFVLALAVTSRAQDAKKPVEVPVLIERLQDKDSHVRRKALESLGSRGKNAVAGIPAINKALNDEDAIVRIYAASALRRIDPETKQALPAMLNALRVKNATVRCYAAVEFRHFDATAVPPLVELFREKDVDLHVWVSGAIVNIGKSAEPLLRAARADADPRVRENIDSTLRYLEDAR